MKKKSLQTNFWDSSTKDYILSKCDFIIWNIEEIKAIKGWQSEKHFTPIDYWKLPDSTSAGLREIELIVESIKEKLNLSFWDKVGYRWYQFKHFLKRGEKC